MTHASTPSTSYLFVPGTHPERFSKALSSGADEVIIDLEDAVAIEDKDRALENACSALIGNLEGSVYVRVNPVESPWFGRDLQRLAKASENGLLRGLILPKAERAADIERLRDALPPQIEILALVETAIGVSKVNEISAARGLARIGIGAVDLSFDLDSDTNSALMDTVYAQVTIASRVAGIASPLGSPPITIHDPGTIEESARRLRGFGLGGQLCIHPAQVAPIHAGFAPTNEQVDWAVQVMASVGGSVQVQGQMVDKPVRDKAQRILLETNWRNR